MFNVKVAPTLAQDVKLISYDAFTDHRGFFTEPYRKSDLFEKTNISGLKNKQVVQINESFSVKHTVRGLHFQYDPYQHKFSRPVIGHIIALAVDVRKNSPTFSLAYMFELKSSLKDTSFQWLYLPPGYAYGFLTLEDSLIQYLLTGEYNQQGEVSICPLAEDINWSKADNDLKSVYIKLAKVTKNISEKDKNSINLTDWSHDSRIKYFTHGNIKA